MMGDIMFYRHLKISDEEKKEESLYLFIDFDYEFGIDFNFKGKKEKVETLYSKVIDYIKEKDIDFKMGKVFLVVGGLVVGSLFISNYQYSDLKNSIEPKYKYVEQIDIFSDNKTANDIFKQENVNEQTNENKATAPTVIETPKAATPAIEKQTDKTTTSQTVTAPPTKDITSNKSNTIISTPTAPEPPTTAPAPIQEPATVPPPTPPPTAPTAPAPAPIENPVTVYRYNGTVEQIALEDYIVGVVAGEMPASFSTEAIKAQSVLARTYALKKIDANQVLKDDTSNQVYKDINQLKSMWGADFQTYYNKIKSAVSATKGQYLSYNGNYIEAVYHSTSNGQTEDSAAVWGNSFPYLKSVDSHWDLNASSYLRETTKEFNVLSSIIGLDFNAATNVEVISKTAGNRIDKIKIGDTVFTGIELRSLLGLRSADFDIKTDGAVAVFVTRGYGHGVGMSQYGANGMAKEGYTYVNILSHYYPGTQLKS
jgi:stage II sporulation protein D